MQQIQRKENQDTLRSHIEQRARPSEKDLLRETEFSISNCEQESKTGLTAGQGATMRFSG